MRKIVVCFLFLLIGATCSAFAADPAQKLYLAATKAESAGDIKAARELYQQIIDRSPNSPLAIKAADRLVDLSKEAAAASAKTAADEKAKKGAQRASVIQHCLQETARCNQVCQNPMFRQACFPQCMRIDCTHFSPEDFIPNNY